MIGLALAFALAPSLALPVHVDGEGYLRFVRDGRIVYSATATLAPKDGVLSSKGLPLIPAVRIPANATELKIDLGGNITAVSGSGQSICGRLVLAKFDGAPILDRGFYVAAGRATIGNPGEGLFGVIRTTGSAAQGTLAVVIVRPISEVDGAEIKLGDVASVEADAQTKAALESLVIGPAPVVGLDFALNAVRIHSIAKRVGIETQVQVPIKAIVRRRAQALKQADFVATAIKAAQLRIGADIQMTCDDPSIDFLAPEGKTELKAESVTTSGTHASVEVAVYVDGKKINSRIVSLKADASGQIQAGSVVKIVMKSAGLSVEVPGKARTGAMVGQQITVTTDTGGILSGIVVGPGRVEVKI